VGVDYVHIVRIILFIIVAVYSGYLLYDSIKNHNRGDLIMAVILLTLLILTRFVSIVYISGPSMQPNFHTGDCVLVLRTQKVERFDVAVVKWQDKWLVKRVVGLPSDSLALSDGYTYINGEQVTEPFEYFSGNRSISEIQIPQEHIFVMGDNRANSHDSRAFGPVAKTEIYGKMVTKLGFISKIPLLSKLIEMMATIQTG
jgi:signal peptidase I